MLQGAMVVWFTLTAFSVVIVVADSLFNGVTSWVQRAAWILVTLYAGPVGLVLYLFTCRRPFVGGHDRFTTATWKQAANSEMHCVAGDATGIVIAASIVPLFGLTNGWDSVVEYLAGFVSGLLIFQALMMLPMYGGDYPKAVRKTFFAETVSMNFVMAGMIPTMVMLAAHWPESENPLSAAFWFRMSLATVVGGVLAYPINYWLVANRLKHGCMTLPGADGPAAGLGHTSPEREMPGMMAHAGSGDGAQTHHHAAHAGAMAAADAAAGGHGGPSPGGGTSKPSAAVGAAGTEHAGHGMEMGRLPAGRATAIVLLTFGFLALAMWLTDMVVPIRF